MFQNGATRNTEQRCEQYVSEWGYEEYWTMTQPVGSRLKLLGKTEEWCIQYVKSEEIGGTEQWCNQYIRIEAQGRLNYDYWSVKIEATRKPEQRCIQYVWDQSYEDDWTMSNQ